MEEKILKSVYESLGKGKKVALVTITNMLGSTPRKKRLSHGSMGRWKY